MELTPLQEEFINGKMLLFDKPLNWTSFDVVNYIRKVISPPGKKTKTGHAGTLDPLATGLLIICTGAFTKRLEEFTGLEKEYTGVITVGMTTPSYDLETEADAFYETNHIENELIFDAASKLTGKILQYPPMFSAKKTDGERAYLKARRGEKSNLNPVEIEIPSFSVTEIKRTDKQIDISFSIVCSKGTYIRSIANDFGKLLSSGAHLSQLRRVRIGKNEVEGALTLDEFKRKFSRHSIKT